MGKTRRSGRPFGIFVFMSLLVLLGLSGPAIVTADGGDNDVSSGSAAEALDNPETKAYLGKIMALVEKAQAGDSQALSSLKQHGKSIREVFPNGEFVGGSWRNAAEVSPINWRDRNFTSVNIPETDASPRLQSAAVAGLVPYRNPAPAFSRNLLITRDMGTPLQNEPHICVSQDDPKNIIVASHNYGSLAPPVHASFDAGETWQGPQRVPLTPQSYFGGDPVLACGKNGKTYYSFMSVGRKSVSLAGIPIDIMKTDIALSLSDDGGINWQEPSVVSTNRFEEDEYSVLLKNPKTGEHEIKSIPVVAFSFLDKNWVAAGPNPDDPAKDAIYVSFTNFTDYMVLVRPFPGIIMLMPLQFTSEIEILRSLDKGRTWEETDVMSPVPAIKDVADTIFSEDIKAVYFRTVQGSQLGVSQDGAVYAAWYDSTYDGFSMGKSEYYAARSEDAGKNWSEPVLFANGLEVEYLPQSAAFRNLSLPQMAIGPNGDVYLVYPGLTETSPSDEGDIYFVRGELKEGDLIPTKPRKLNQDRTNNLQFFPSVAVGPDGIIHVMWGDTRDDPASVKYHIYYTKSQDQGKTWGFEARGIKEPETRVTDFPSNPNKGFPGGRFIGDYFGIAATDKDAYMVWTDSRLAEYGPMNQKIGFARKSAVPSPEIFLNPGRGSSGKEVEVQAFNFQPDMSVFVRLGGYIVSGGRTNDEGRLQFKLLVPIVASEGTQEVMVFDESGNTAVASFYVDFGFDNLKTISDDVRAAQEKVAESEAAVAKARQAHRESSRRLGGIIIVALVVLAVTGLYIVYRRRRTNRT